MKIISWNVNGLRSIYRKGFLDWLKRGNFDIVCLQEIKTRKDQLSFDFFEPVGYKAIFNSAERPGYSGVAVYTKIVPEKIERKLGLSRFDEEGRMLKLEFGNFTLINVYIPHGSRDKHNLDYKLEVYGELNDMLKGSFDKLRTRLRNKKVILVGDFNVAHKEIDLARPENNKNNIMFTEEERKQIDNIINSGFVDTFREFNKEGGYYSWWPYRLDLRKRNIGWRIDYLFVSGRLIPQLKNAFILRGVEGSDHCPVGIEIAV